MGTEMDHDILVEMEEMELMGTRFKSRWTMIPQTAGMEPGVEL